MYMNSNIVSQTRELPCPTALGATRPSLVEGGAPCFCVGTCIRRGHSGSRLRRRLPLTGGLECPTPTEWTPGHNRERALLVTLEHPRGRGGHRTISLDRGDSKRVGERVCEPCGRCIPSLLAPSALAEEGGLAPSIIAKTPDARLSAIRSAVRQYCVLSLLSSAVTTSKYIFSESPFTRLQQVAVGISSS
jgi:hypothetical protein